MNGTNSANFASEMPAMSLLQMITASWVTQCVYVAAKLGVADLLKDGPKKRTDELAILTETHEPSFYRILCANDLLHLQVVTRLNYLIKMII